MDKKKLEEMREPPAMKMARENQARLDKLSLATGATDNLLKIAKDLDYFKSLTGYTTSQGLLSQLSQSNLAIDGSISGMLNTLSESSSLNPSLFESNKFNKAIIDAFKATHLGLKPATQFILPEGFASKNQVSDLSSVISKATEVFRQYEQFGELESLKAISSLKNFPFKDLVQNNFDYSTELKESSDKTILELDLEISERLSIVDDFNDFSIEEQDFLLSSFRTYYYPIILNCLITLYWLKNILDENLDLSNKTFIFVEKSKENLFYIGNVCRPKLSGVIEGIVGSAIFTLIMKVFG